jgi:hypothetical protein
LKTIKRQPSSRNSLIFLAAVALFMVLGSSRAMAQEHSYGKEEIEHATNNDLNNHSANDADQTVVKNQSADTLNVYRPMISRPKPKLSEARNHEEDALKFNFLYIIFQKFKFSDIIE